MTRDLSDEERELWDRVVRKARRMHATPPEPAAKASAAPPALRPPAAPERHLPVKPSPKHRVTPPATRLEVSRPLEEELSAAPLRMDAGTHRRMIRGKLEPEARIDLHGMTRAEAHSALTGFLLSAQGRGLRLVLVITGKGREREGDLAPIPSRAGTLRHDLPHWIALAPLRAAVLDLRPAHRSHGGGGAFYVYLRRRR